MAGLAAGRKVDRDKVSADYKSAVDWPSAHYWREIADHFPDAKVLLSLRPAERWRDSFSGTIKTIMELGDAIPDDHPRAVLAMATEIVANQTFGGAPGDKTTALAAFQKRIDDATAAIAPERLLKFDLTEGWAPLCKFLGVPVPSGDFPRSNSREEFWEAFGGGAEPVG